jgi:hypothetical protein
MISNIFCPFIPKMVATAIIVLKKLEKGDLDQKFVWQLNVKVFQKHSKVFFK